MIKKSYIKNSLRNICFGIFGQIIIVLLNFFTRKMFVSTLSIEYLGINGLFNNIISLLALSELGIGSAIVYHLYKPVSEKNEEEIAKILYFYKKVYNIIGIVILVFSIFLLPFLNNIIKDAPNISESLKVIYLFFVFNTVITYFYSYKTTLLFVDEKDYVIQIVSIVEKILESIFQIAILVITKNYLLFLTVKSVLIFVKNIYLSYLVNKLYPFIKKSSNSKISLNIKKRIFLDTKYLMLIKLSGILVNNIDNILISMFVGIAQVGIYSNYVLIISALDLLLDKIFNGIKASIGKIIVRKEIEEKQFFLVLNFINFYLYGLVAIGILVNINDILRLWLGEKFLLSLDVILILTVNFYIRGLQQTVAIFKEILGLFDKMAYILLFTAGINFVLSIILGRKMGLFGIFFATFIARLLTNAWYEPFVISKTVSAKFKKYLFNNIYYVFILIISYFLVEYICNFVIVENIFNLITKILLCFILNNIVFLLLFCKKYEFKYIVRSLR